MTTAKPPPLPMSEKNVGQVRGEGHAAGSRGLGQDGGHRRVQRELHEDARGGRDGLRHGLQEVPRRPVQDQAQDEEHQQVAVEAADHAEERLGEELRDEPAEREDARQDRQDPAVFEPFARPGPRRGLARFIVQVHAQVLRGADRAALGRGEVRNHGGQGHQDGQRQQRLPGEDRGAEVQDAGDLQQRRRQRRGRGLQLRGRGGQPQRPDGAEAHERRRAEGR